MDRQEYNAVQEAQPKQARAGRVSIIAQKRDLATRPNKTPIIQAKAMVKSNEWQKITSDKPTKARPVGTKIVSGSKPVIKSAQSKPIIKIATPPKQIQTKVGSKPPKPVARTVSVKHEQKHPQRIIGRSNKTLLRPMSERTPAIGAMGDLSGAISGHEQSESIRFHEKGISQPTTLESFSYD